MCAAVLPGTVLRSVGLFDQGGGGSQKKCLSRTFFSEKYAKRLTKMWAIDESYLALRNVFDGLPSHLCHFHGPYAPAMAVVQLART